MTDTQTQGIETSQAAWPGFGKNCGVLAWIFRRCDGEADAEDTPIGRVPAPEHRLSCG